ncbi:LEF-8 [Aratus pisonii nudivirus]|nr:LEF-8 [Aratus pisonii nudivirus]
MVDQLPGLTNILEYNYKFKDIIIHKCPCYKEEYRDFNKICIENKSYMACIVIIKESCVKILHLKLPIVFGSFIDYSIRGENMTNYNQFGCLYLDGCVKVIYNFISNNLTHGHVYANKKTGEEIFKVDIEDDDHSLHLKYNPKKEVKIQSVIQNIKLEKKRKLEKLYNDAKSKLENEKRYDIEASKKKRQKTKLLKNIEKINEDLKQYDNVQKMDENDVSKNDWVDIINKKASKMTNLDCKYEFTAENYIDLFDAYLNFAPKLDDISNKVNRTLSYIMHRALMHNIDTCYAQDPELKNLNSKITSMYNNGNMFFTLAQYLNTESKLVKGYRSIYQNIEAQKINLASLLTSTIKRSVNDSIKNSKALLYPADGYEYTCTVDSREMKGAGENVMLSQLVIVPVALDSDKVMNYVKDNEEQLLSGDEGKILRCVLNSFLQPFRVRSCNLLQLKAVFPTLSLMIFGNFLILYTNGYNQMKYSVKYNCFMNTHEYQYIWKDAFEDYHPHLAYNSCAMFLPDTIEMGLPAKLTVANANIRGRCLDINNLLELILFLHTNGASNAAIIHKYQKGDKRALISFDGKKHKNDYHISIPIHLKNPQMRYLDIGFIGKVDTLPPMVKIIHDNYHPKEDDSEAYGLSMKDVLQNPNKSIENIYKILFDLYENDDRLEFVDVNQVNIIKSDKPLIVNNKNSKEQVIFDNKQYNLKCFIRKNDNIEDYKKLIQFDINKKHSPHMYVNVAFGDMFGGTNEDGIVIDEKLVKYGPKKLISQTLNITYKDESKKDTSTITYSKIGNIIKNEIVFGCLSSNVKLSFNKTKNTNIKETYIPPDTYNYVISVDNISKYKKYMSSTFFSKECSINIHYSYLVPIGIGTKFSTGHGQKGVVSKVVDMSHIKGYTKDGEVVHPLVLFSPTSVLGRTMSSQVMSMHCQSKRAFTEEGILISPHGINIHNIDPSIKSRISEVKNDLMTTENGFLTNKLVYMMKVLVDQKTQHKHDKHKLHFMNQLCNLQGVNIKLVSFNNTILSESV